MSRAPFTSAVVHRALCIADRAVVADIESVGLVYRPTPGGTRWYDVTAWLDPHEHCPEAIDMASEALAYAHARGLITAHPDYPHRVRITRRPGPDGGAAQMRAAPIL